MTTLEAGRTDVRRPALLVVQTAALAAAALLVVLHLVQPQLDPAWSVVSQYALGAQGWLMATVFVLLAVACGALAAALPAERLRRAGRVGRVLLAVAVVGLLLAALFVVGNPVHEIGSLLGNLGLALAAVLVGRDLRRGADARIRRLSAVAAHAPWVLAVVMAALIATTTWGVGIANRLIVLAYVVWLVIAARQAARA